MNSKGYKVCGEASSVCGTITINKRKVGIIDDYGMKCWRLKLPFFWPFYLFIFGFSSISLKK